MAAAPVLTLKELNRATLARQMLLEREPVAPARAVERLAGMQAQEPRPPFVGLWSRVEGFDRDALLAALQSRKVVRATLMRGTLHLVAAKDYLAFRPGLEPLLGNPLRVMGKQGEGIEPDRVVPVAHRLLSQGPMTFNELRPQLAKAFPSVWDRGLGYVARTMLPLVMVPTDDRWGFARDSQFTLAGEWLGRPPGSESADALVRSYLAAFGPASVADFQTWSGLTQTKAAFERMRPRLEVFADERGRELFDLPEAPRPGAGVPAPLRFLPEFDNLVLGHADRSRIIASEHRSAIFMKGNLRIRATFLWGGMVAGTWTAECKRKVATLRLEPFKALPKKAIAEAQREGEQLLRFLESAAESFVVAT